ncbi:MAG TPA: hypothetical protein VGM84_22705 [Steroidobacteraceae bacterium]
MLRRLRSASSIASSPIAILRPAAAFLALAAVALACGTTRAATAESSSELAPGVFSPDGSGALQSSDVERRPHRVAPFDTTPNTASAPAVDFTGVIKDQEWALVLGKALFWDTVAGAKGNNCTSCHFTSDINRSIPDQAPSDTQMRRVSQSSASTDQPGASGSLFEIAFGHNAASDDIRGVVDVCGRGMAQVNLEIPDSGHVTRISSTTSDAAESSCGNDNAARLARSVLQHRPLALRSIDPKDGVFGQSGPHGNLVSSSGRGLEKTYAWLVKQSFEETLWKNTTAASGDTGGDGEIPQLAPIPSQYDRIERNFPLFWGIAVYLYESTLNDDLLSHHAAIPDGGDWTPAPPQRSAPSLF